MLISRNLMSRKPISRYLLLAATALLLSGCANRPTPLATSLKSFQPSKANPNQMVYQEPGTDLKKYHAVMIDPLLFAQHQESGKLIFLSAGDQNEIGNYFQQQLRHELAQQGVKVSEQAGVGVARIQAAVTGLDLQRPDMKVRDLLPSKLAIDLTKQVVGKESYLLDVSSMTQLLDSQSGKLLVRAMNIRKDDDKVTKDQPLTLTELKPLIDDWCRITARQLATHMAGSTS